MKKIPLQTVSNKENEWSREKDFRCLIYFSILFTFYLSGKIGKQLKTRWHGYCYLPVSNTTFDYSFPQSWQTLYHLKFYCCNTDIKYRCELALAYNPASIFTFKNYIHLTKYSYIFEMYDEILFRAHYIFIYNTNISSLTYLLNGSISINVCILVYK